MIQPIKNPHFSMGISNLSNSYLWNYWAMGVYWYPLRVSPDFLTSTFLLFPLPFIHLGFYTFIFILILFSLLFKSLLQPLLLLFQLILRRCGGDISWWGYPVCLSFPAREIEHRALQWEPIRISLRLSGVWNSLLGSQKSERLFVKSTRNPKRHCMEVTGSMRNQGFDFGTSMKNFFQLMLVQQAPWWTA